MSFSIAGWQSPQPDPAPAPSVQQQAAAAGLPLGVIPYVFGITTLGASQNALQLYRTISAFTPTGVQVPVYPPFVGSVVGLTVNADAAKTTGVATFQVYQDGAALFTASLIWDNVAHQEVTFPVGTASFGALDALDVRVTTDGSFAPTTLNLEVVLYVQQAAA